MTTSRSAVRVGGMSLIASALGFMVVFSWLAARFDYPAVLDGPASTVLPQLLALGSTGRAVWVGYALLPLLLIPAGVGASAALRTVAPSAMRTAVVLSVVAAISMLLGLARWPTIHWALATHFASASTESRVAIEAVFNGLNGYLGNFVGEFLGEIALNGFFILVGYGMLRAGRRWPAYGGIAAGLIGLIAAFRNVTDAVALIADANNLVLPVWLIVLGILMVRWRGADRSPRFRDNHGEMES